MSKASAFRRVIWILAGVAAVFSSASAQTASTSQAVPNKQAVLRAAIQSYYNLHDEGMAGFQCEVTPDWEGQLAPLRKTNPAGADAALKVFNQIHFIVNYAPDDTVNLTHNELTGLSDAMNSALKQIYAGMDQMTSGFFDTWKLFMTGRPLPDAGSTYELNDLGPRYRLTYKENTADVTTTMGHDYAISTMQTTTPVYDSSILPTFSSVAGKYLLTGYDGTYRSGKAEENTQLTVSLNYQLVQGLQLPQHFHMRGSYGNAPFDIEMTYSNCRATMK